VAMAKAIIYWWKDPKTDWTADDYFNIDDYERIVNDIDTLQKRISKVYGDVEISSISLSKTYTDMIYASEFNTIISNIQVLNDKSYKFDFGTFKTYKDSGRTPNYQDFNQIENAISLLYRTVEAEIANMSRLAFRLGNVKTIK
jgi:hypothetical protein